MTASPHGDDLAVARHGKGLQAREVVRTATVQQPQEQTAVNRMLPFQPPIKQNLTFKRKTEARWAFFFASLGLEWYYEPRKFRFEDSSAYTPDFFVCGLGWIEIKEDLRECNLAISKARKLVTECNAEVVGGARHFTICGDWVGFDDSVLFEWRLGAGEPFLFSEMDALALFATIHGRFDRCECQKRVDFANGIDLRRFGSLTPEGIQKTLDAADLLANCDRAVAPSEGYTVGREAIQHRSGTRDGAV